MCVDIAGEEHKCKCNMGWKGPTCKDCQILDGCVVENTVDATLDGSGDGCMTISDTGATSEVPNSCQCTKDWTGIFCEQPKCLNEDGTAEISCLHGECVEGGKVCVKKMKANLWLG